MEITPCENLIERPVWSLWNSLGTWGNMWGVLCQKQVSRAGTINYIPQYLWDVITCPCAWYLLLAQHYISSETVWWKCMKCEYNKAYRNSVLHAFRTSFGSHFGKFLLLFKLICTRPWVQICGSRVDHQRLGALLMVPIEVAVVKGVCISWQQLTLKQLMSWLLVQHGWF